MKGMHEGYSMNRNLPTLEDCELIVSKNPAFKCKTEVIEGKTVKQFNYFLAKHTDFVNPIPGSSLTAEELRGITFVEQDGSFKRFLMLPKFFNLNQTEGSMYNDVKDLTISNTQDKLDGSMISFVKIADKVMAKTKFSFYNEQSYMAQEIYERNYYIKTVVDNAINEGYFPIFELVSPKNRIVLDYTFTELRLIQLRRTDGSFVDIYENLFREEFKNIIIVDREVHDLDHMMTLAQTQKNKEGWVVTFNNGHMIKIKTDWYFENHRLMTGDINVEHKIIEMTLNETLDDVLSQLPEHATELRDFVNLISDGISEYVDKRVNDLLLSYENCIAHYLTIKQDISTKKDYVIFAQQKHPQFFKELMTMFDKGNNIEQVEKLIIDDVLKKTNGLEKARKFLKDIGCVVHYTNILEDD